MGLFSGLLDRLLHWSKHRHAPYYLACMSFFESSVFPIPPDVMLVSMTLAEPQKAWRYAFITAMCSAAGGIFGYCLGSYFFHYVEPWIVEFGYTAAYQQVQQWFGTWGFWIIIFAGFIPIPYKIFSIGAGAAHMIFWPFILASLVSRSVRFFLVTAIIYYGGSRLYRGLYRYIEYFGWLILSLIGIFCVVRVAHSI